MSKEADIFYKDYGFVYTYGSINRLFAWNRILKIIAYKADLLTIDEVRLEIWDNDGGITITEEEDFWKDFTGRILEQYPEIDKEWFSKIIQPPFARNETVIYKKTVNAFKQ